MRREEVQVAGRPAALFTGGSGAPLVLLHGGWGGAELHWSRVWEGIAERALVIAPELPGIGDRQPALGGVGAYAAWLEALLDARALPSATLVGNSFGAAVACALATRSPSRVRSLVLVNGAPLGRMPLIVAHAAGWPPTRALLKRVFRRNTFSERARAQAFARPDELSAELRAVFAGDPPQLDALVDVVARGGDDGLPSVRTLLLFGDADRFPPTSPNGARALHAKLPGAHLVFVRNAGHLPQLEQPEPFLAALLPFVAATG